VKEGTALEIRDGSVFTNGTLVAAGQVLTWRCSTGSSRGEAEHRVELTKFVENTLTYVVDEQALLFESPAIPRYARSSGAALPHRGARPGAEADLAAIRSYINAVRPC